MKKTIEILKFTPEEEGGLGFWTTECVVPIEEADIKLEQLRKNAPCSEFKLGF